MKNVILVFLLISSTIWNFSTPTQHTVSLLTVDQANSFHPFFGHSAIRIKIDTSNSDFVHNFGMFSYTKQELYYNLVGGNLIFYMNKEPYDQFISHYEQNKRSVCEQVLDMDSVKTMFIFNLLRITAKTKIVIINISFFIIIALPVSVT